MPHTGTVETAAAPFWRTLRDTAPEARVVVLRRDPAAVLDSLLRLDLGVDAEVMGRTLWRNDAKLQQIAVRWPGVLAVRFEDLECEATCAAVFEHCLQLPHDHAWWRALAPLDLQCNAHAMMRYFVAYAPQVARLVAELRGGRSQDTPDTVVPMVQRADYTLAMERIGGVSFAHVRVRRWSAQVMRAMRCDVDAVLALHGGPIFAAYIAADTGTDVAKWRKFNAVMGFEHVRTIEVGGEPRPIYVRWR